MKQRVYVETSIVSYLTGRPSRDTIIAAHQELTRQWWETRAGSFDLVVSELVREEAARGDSEAASTRISAIEELLILGTSDKAVLL